MRAPMLEAEEVRAIVVEAFRHAVARGLGLSGAALHRFVERVTRHLEIPPQRMPPVAIRFEMRDPLLRALSAAGCGGGPAATAMRMFDEHLAWHHPATAGRRTAR